MPTRWVLVRDPEGKRAPQAFFSTGTSLEPSQIIALFVRRWQIEVTFAETRAHLVTRDPAARVRQGHPANDPGPAGALQPHIALGLRPAYVLNEPICCCLV